MPVKELENFRKKYPQYNDLDDLTLATKLARKYPEYRDLVGKVEVIRAYRPTLPQRIRDIGRKTAQFLGIKDYPLISRQTSPVETAVLTAGRAFTGGVIKPDEYDIRAMRQHPVASAIGQVAGGIAPYILTAPFFPPSLLGTAATFGTVSALQETAKQLQEEEKSLPNKLKDIAKETAKATAYAPVWHYSRGLKIAFKPYLSALTRAGIRGVGTAGLSKIFGDDLESALKQGGLTTALSLIFEAPFLAKTALGRQIIKETNRIAKEAGLPEGKITIDPDRLDAASTRTSIFKLIRGLFKLRKIKGVPEPSPTTQPPKISTQPTTTEPTPKPPIIQPIEILRKQLIAKYGDIETSFGRISKLNPKDLEKIAREPEKYIFRPKQEPTPPAEIKRKIEKIEKITPKKAIVLPNKKELLKQIEAAIKKAPEKIPPEDKPTVSFKIDGGADIVNTKEALTTFYKNIKKTPAEIPLTSKPKKTTIPAFNAHKEKIDDLYQISGLKGWWSDGKILIKGEPPKTSKFSNKEIGKEQIENILSSPTTPAKKLYYYINTEELKGVSPNPIPADFTSDTPPKVVFQSKGKYYIYDQFRFNALNKRYPDVSYGIADNGLLIAYKNNQPVGALLPMKIGEKDYLTKPPMEEAAKRTGLLETLKPAPKETEKPKIEEIPISTLKGELLERGFSKDQLVKATPETIKILIEKNLKPEEVSILPNGKLKIIKPPQKKYIAVDSIISPTGTTKQISGILNAQKIRIASLYEGLQPEDVKVKKIGDKYWFYVPQSAKRIKLQPKAKPTELKEELPTLKTTADYQKVDYVSDNTVKETLKKYNLPKEREFEVYLSQNIDNEKARTIITEIVKTLGKGIKVEQLKGGTLGVFSPSTPIRIKNIYNIATLAHETGHFIDYALAKAKGLSQDFIPTLAERIDIDISKLPLKEKRKIEEKLISELKKVADYIRPFDRKKASRGYLAYRNRKTELFADFFTVYLFKPQKVEELAPTFTRGFKDILFKYPTIREALSKFYQTPEVPFLPEEIKKKSFHFTQNLLNFARKVEPEEGVKVVPQEPVTKEKLQRIINTMALPFWRGITHPDFGAVYKAIQDYGVYEHNEKLAEALEKADLRGFLKLPRISQEKVAEAVYVGNDKGVNKYWSDENLKDIFYMNQEEIEAYHKIVNTVKYATNLLVEARKISFRVDELPPERRKEVIDYLNDQIKKLEGYFPIDRFGNWAIFGEQEEEMFFTLRPKQKEAIKLANWLKNAGYKNVEVYPVKKLPREILSKYKHFSIFDLERIAELAGIDSKDPTIKKIREYLLEKGIGRRLLQRKYTPGYDRTAKNLIDSLIDFIEGTTRVYARTKARTEAYKALKGISPSKNPEMYRYAVNFIDNFLNSNQQEFSLLRQIIYSYYLAWKTSFFVVNSTQPLITTWAEIAKYASGINPEKILSNSYIEAGKILIRRLLTKKIIASDKELQGMLEKAQKQGVISGRRAVEFILGVKRPIRSTISKTLGIMSAGSETLNRWQSFIAGYKVGKRMKLKGEELYEFAKNFVNKTQYAFGAQNLPEFIEGAGKVRGLLKLGFIFRTFFANYLHWFTQTMLRGTLGAKIRALASLLLLAGIQGLPFFALFSWLWTKLSHKDLETQVREVLKEAPKIADVITRGLPTIAGVDLSRQAGIGDIILPTRDPLDFWAGVGYDMLKRAKRATYYAFERNEPERAIEQLSPVAIQRMLEAIRWSEEGVRSVTGELIHKPAKKEILIRALGLQPLALTKKYKLREVERLEKERARELNVKYYERLAKLYAGSILSSRKKDWKAYNEFIKEIKATFAEIKQLNQTLPSHQRIILHPSTLNARIAKILQEGLTLPELRTYPRQLRPRILELEKLYGK